jgi:hypothetical protein
VTTVGGTLCLTLYPDTTVTLRWPMDLSMAFAIQSGASYQFSYKAQLTGDLASFQARVGQAASPYTRTDYQTSPTLGATLAPYTHTFTATAAGPQAGVSFTWMTSAGNVALVCLDDVAVRAVN